MAPMQWYRINDPSQYVDIHHPSDIHRPRFHVSTMSLQIADQLFNRLPSTRSLCAVSASMLSSPRSLWNIRASEWNSRDYIFTFQVDGEGEVINCTRRFFLPLTHKNHRIIPHSVNTNHVETVGECGGSWR